MLTNRYPVIAREWWVMIVILMILAGVSYYHFGTTSGLEVSGLLVFALFLSRDPDQPVPSTPLAVVCPVFGKVTNIENMTDPWVGREARCIRIKMSPWDIYSLRSPIEGKIVNQWTRRADQDNKNNRFAFRIRTDEGDEVVVVINMNFLGSLGIRFYAHSGERLGQGQRCGYLFFGCVVDVLLPQKSRIVVTDGARVESGSQELATLVHAQSVSAIKTEAEQT